MTDTADVVVVGGGSTGTSIAWHLARRGAGRVVLLDKDGIAAGATGRSSAIIRQHYTHETLARMALYALGIFEHFADIVGGDAGFHRAGFLVLVGPPDRHALAANVAMHRRVGIDANLLGPEQVREIEPRAHRSDVGAAAWEPRSGYADPVLTANSFATAARALGVEQRIGVVAAGLVVGPSGIEAVETASGRIATRTVVVAAGFRSVGLLAPLGVELSLRPVRHSIAIVQRSPGFGASHPVISDRINGSYYRPEGAELTLIGTTAPFEGVDDPEVEADQAPADDEVAALAGRFWRRFPSEESALLRRGYTGVYDCSPDLQPILGPVREVTGLYVAAGFSGHGFKLSPAIGALLSEQLLTGRTSLVDGTLFSPARFAQNRLIRSEHGYSVATLG